MNLSPHIWPPPPALPEFEPPRLQQAFGNERLGALSPLCVTLGFATALLSSVLFTVLYLSGFLVLAGIILGILNWRTDGGKTGIGLVLFPLLLFLFVVATQRFH